jgi:hypothetical protein
MNFEPRRMTPVDPTDDVRKGGRRSQPVFGQLKAVISSRREMGGTRHSQERNKALPSSARRSRQAAPEGTFTADCQAPK